ncbi:glycosyltransferase [Herbiconiux sp. L3-i23]|uniref:glycosyltransferase n=1 Tax=Herbiconiux sp. L3-i23 TaxID=2905871 RepID=UPI0020605F43|nr:glycosyltransferase [Herbiconiux sp. L3-i23]BDI24037.1 glycosyl transferase family 1 [Herbiconiux sp. L3-i23]
MTRDSAPLTIAVLAPLRHPIREPHAGGLEAAVWDRVRSLRARGHRVVLCAVEGSDFLDGGPDEFVLPAAVWPIAELATDTTYPPGHLERALAALEGALDFIADNAASFDVIDNHCLHAPPLARAGRLGVPMLTTLHTPPLDDMLGAHASGGGSLFSAVSAHTASEWAAAGVSAPVLPNSVDPARWTLGSGGIDLVWFGRIVPEKGTHLAIAAARAAGRRLNIAGRVGDADYFEQLIAPQLDADIRYVGALRQPALAELVGGSAAALVTPVWEEPFGMVIAEALATGTPVAAFDIGGVAEVTGDSGACRLVPVRDVDALAEAVTALADTAGIRASTRRRTRRDALARFSIERRSDELESLLRSVASSPAVRAAVGA